MAPGRRHAPPAVRRRPRALARRPLVGGRRPHAGALGRGLRAREPARRLARLPAAVPRAAGAAPGAASSTRCATRCARWAPRGDGAAADRAAHARARTTRPTSSTRCLARYLGFALVEGSDLTVRDDRVWLKTIDGLQRVHAILRRQDDDYCDPLELRSDSALGVAGLTDCARARQRAARQRARLGRARVGRAARLPAAAGARAARRAAAAAVGRDLVVRRAGRARRTRGRAPRPADHQAARALAAASRPIVRRRPVAPTSARRCASASRRGRSDYVAQEWVHVSQAPVLESARIAERSRRAPSACASSRCATPSGWRVMPGGLTRVAGDDGLARHRDAARRPLEGHLGARRRAGQRRVLAAARHTVDADDLVDADADAGVARRREPVLVRPLRRALRRRRRGCCASRSATCIDDAGGADGGAPPALGAGARALGLIERRPQRVPRAAAPRRDRIPRARAGRSACASSRASPSACATGCRPTTGAPSTA